jgi:hypothetical protein
MPQAVTAGGYRATRNSPRPCCPQVRLRGLRACKNQDPVPEHIRVNAETLPARYVTAAAAIIPDMVRNTLKDHMAENGITEEDLEETARRERVVSVAAEFGDPAIENLGSLHERRLAREVPRRTLMP